jgi:hypothetical protein
MECEIWGFHGGEDDDVLLGLGAEDGDSMFLQNVGIDLRVYTAPKPRWSSSSERTEILLLKSYTEVTCVAQLDS